VNLVQEHGDFLDLVYGNPALEARRNAKSKARRCGEKVDISVGVQKIEGEGVGESVFEPIRLPGPAWAEEEKASAGKRQYSGDHYPFLFIKMEFIIPLC
jgi:hypothetical protein